MMPDWALVPASAGSRTEGLYIAAYSRQTSRIAPLFQAECHHRAGPNYTRRMSTQTETPERARRGPEPPDLSEKGGAKNGQPQRSDERLFMQLLAFGGCTDTQPLADALAAAAVTAVLYQDLNDPRGIALLTVSENPAVFLDRVRRMLNTAPFASLNQKPEYTMLGR